MLGAAIIVFRETLEAALLIGIIAAATRGLPARNRWLALGIAAGLGGSLAVAGLTEQIAEWADGVGQELFNAIVLGIAVVMLAWHNIWMSRHGREMAAQARSVGQRVREGSAELSAIATVIALAVLREGAETVLFLYGMASGGTLEGRSALLGGGLGLAGGIVVGSALYAGLVRIPIGRLFTITGGLLLLMASGMAGQMARNLIQGNLINTDSTPLWDTSSLLPMDSLTGSLLHILAGYEARPSATQAIFYAATFCIILTGMRLARPGTRVFR
ncbi:MAG: FTR1 family protein [Proteobacteria bacterium]|nr:FTR1 family protein [Pseudomonadota bacterium]HQR04582.1 FTR1 family protein [Rhodocyclaceae bacterium]